LGTPLSLTRPPGGFPWDDLRKILCGSSRMDRVTNRAKKIQKV